MKKLNSYHWVLLATLTMVLVGCSNSGKIQITDEEIVSSCNILADEGCKESYELAKNDPVKILEDGRLQITTLTGCDIDFEIQSIEEKNDKIALNLVEKGIVSKCGGELQIVTIQTNPGISLDNLEVYKYSEHLKETIKVYPVENSQNESTLSSTEINSEPAPTEEVEKQASTIDKDTRTLIERDQIGSFIAKLPEPCEFDKIDALHFSTYEGNEWASYKNLEKGLEASIPYNSEWGASEYRLNPFDEEENGISFGTINVRGEGCGAWMITERLAFLPFETKEATLKRLEKESAAENYPYTINSLTIGDKEVVEYDKDGMCGGGGTIVIGKKYNYEFSQHCGSNTNEDIIKSMKFVD